MEPQAIYLQRIHEAYPELDIQSVYANEIGQFNDILILNHELIFRFPRYQSGVEKLIREVNLLERLQDRLSLPIPNPIFTGIEIESAGQTFVGYTMIPGEPLWPDTLAAIEDEQAITHLAVQLATFLTELHHIPAETLGVNLAYADTLDEWAFLYDNVQKKLYPYMRPEIRQSVQAAFETFLGQPDLHNFTPCLRHGDFGPSNILYDPDQQCITGVIDFQSAALGDAAVDLAAVSMLGEPFMRRFILHYPRAEALASRAGFYRSTFALQEALAGLEDGDQRVFNHGMQGLG